MSTTTTQDSATEFFVKLGTTGAKAHPAKTINIDGKDRIVLTCSCPYVASTVGWNSAPRPLIRLHGVHAKTCKG